MQSGISLAYSYSQSRGFFAGLCLDASLLLPRHEVNLNFYGTAYAVGQILSGRVPAPVAAKSLYEILAKVLAVSEARLAGASLLGRSSSSNSSTTSSTGSGAPLSGGGFITTSAAGVSVAPAIVSDALRPASIFQTQTLNI